MIFSFCDFLVACFLAPDAVKLEASGDLSFFYKQDDVSSYLYFCFLSFSSFFFMQS